MVSDHPHQSIPYSESTKYKYLEGIRFCGWLKHCLTVLLALILAEVPEIQAICPHLVAFLELMLSAEIGLVQFSAVSIGEILNCNCRSEGKQSIEAQETRESGI